MDEKSAEAWLKDKPREVQLAFAARGALRWLAALGLLKERHLRKGSLVFLRGCLTLIVATIDKSSDVKDAVDAAARFRGYPDSISTRIAALRDVFSISASEAAIAGTVTSAIRFALALANSRNKPEIIEDVATLASIDIAASSKDANSLDSEGSEQVFRHPLWSGASTQKGQALSISALIAFWDSHPTTWGFWRDWYQGMLDGKPMDWELQKRVALIPDDDWKKGPAHVARLIEEIRARFELEAEIDVLKQELRAQESAIAKRLHNNPPELVEEAKALRQELTVVWETLGEVESEIARDAPSPSRLRELAKAILQIAMKFAVYCGSLADAGLQAAAKELGIQGGKWMGRAATAYFIAQIQPVQAGLEHVAALIEKLAALR